MHLFESEWLREPPRAVVDSHARRAYGHTHGVRSGEVDGDEGVPKLPGRAGPAQVSITSQLQGLGSTARPDRAGQCPGPPRR